MAQGTEHHLEEAKHLPHHAHDPFDRHVAMTMAIVAAVLAGVAMLSHRAHTETLSFQIQADSHHTMASDKWSYYQAKKNRQYVYENDAGLLHTLARDAPRPEAAELTKSWTKRAQDYHHDAEKLKDEAEGLDEQAKHLEEESEHAHHRADRYDLGELGVELALVLCSVAVLTKQRGFWYAGIGFCVLGLVVALTGVARIGLTG